MPGLTPVKKKRIVQGYDLFLFFLLQQILALTGQQVTNAGIATTQNNLTVNDAGIEEVRAQRDNAERELQRYRKLLEEDAVTRQEYDNVKTARDVINARYEQVFRMKFRFTNKTLLCTAAAMADMLHRRHLQNPGHI